MSTPTTPLRRCLTLTVAIALACVAAQASAQWKWRDKDGRVTVSDRPPPTEIADKDILSRPSADTRRSLAAAAAAASIAASGAPPLVPGKGPLDKELEARKRAADQDTANKAKAEEERLAAAKAENCKRARSHQAALDSGQRIARVNARGEREVLDDRGRAEEQRQVREVIASDCR